MINILKAEILKLKVEILNYYPDQIVDVIIKLILYFALFKRNFNDYSIVTYFYWIIGTTLITELSISMSQEKQTGTVDAIMSSPYSMLKILTIRSYTIFIYSLLKSIILVLFIQIVTKSHIIVLNPNTILIFLISLIGFTGLGIFLAGLTLKFAKIASFEQLLMYILLIASAIIPDINSKPQLVQIIIKAFPFTNAQYLSYNFTTVSLPLNNIVFLLFSNLFTLIIGILTFRKFIQEATLKGIANHY